HALHHLHIVDVKLIAAGGALVRADFSRDDHAGLVGKVLERIEDLRGHLVLGHHALDHTGAIAKDGKNQFAALALVVEPAVDGHSLAVMLADFGDCGDRSLSCGFHKITVDPNTDSSSRRP